MMKHDTPSRHSTRTYNANPRYVVTSRPGRGVPRVVQWWPLFLILGIALLLSVLVIGCVGHQSVEPGAGGRAGCLCHLPASALAESRCREANWIMRTIEANKEN